MSNTTTPISDESDRMRNNIAAAYSKLEQKGIALPASQTSDNLADKIDEIKTVSMDYQQGTLVINII
jgi:hypothetical protein